MNLLLKDLINQVGQIEHGKMSLLETHVDVVDARDTKGLWMFMCVYFRINKWCKPIYGF